MEILHPLLVLMHFPLVKKSLLIITVSVIGKSLFTVLFCSQLERGCLFLVNQPLRSQLSISATTHQRTIFENLKEMRQWRNGPLRIINFVKNMRPH